MSTQNGPHVVIREGSLQTIDSILSQIGAERIFFVMDKPAYEGSGAATVLEPVLSSRQVAVFDQFELNPKIEDVERGKQAFTALQPQAVLALGGGSALDMAKLIAACSVQDGPALEYAIGKKPLAHPHPPIIAVPTTSGTGSEATHFAVVYAEGKKYSLAHERLLPDYVIIDPLLTHSLPAGPTANSGLDALSQAIESLWARGATEESMAWSTEALQLVLDNLITAVTRPDDASRLNMAKAAHLAGKAINVTKTTAPHAVSYGITTHFGVPHGSAVGLTLGAFLLFNAGVDEQSCTDPRGIDEVRRRLALILNPLGNGSLTTARERLTTIISECKCPARLSEVGVTETDLPFLADQVNVERLSNNPRTISREQLIALLKSAL